MTEQIEKIVFYRSGEFQSEEGYSDFTGHGAGWQSCGNRFFTGQGDGFSNAEGWSDSTGKSND